MVRNKTLALPGISSQPLPDSEEPIESVGSHSQRDIQETATWKTL